MNESEALADIKEYIQKLNIPESEKDTFVKDFEKAINSNSVMKPIRLLALVKRIKKITEV